MEQTPEQIRASVDAMLALDAINDALNDLATARDKLRNAGAPRAADYVARAMKSADGARRHAEGKFLRLSR